MINDDKRRELLAAMIRLRVIEEEIARRYPAEEMRCPVHLSVGQEAAAVGAASALQPHDLVVSTHRGHGHYLAKGGDAARMIAEIHGRATGCSGGRGGSMNLTDRSAGVIATIPIVGSSIPVGVGAALRDRLVGGDAVVAIFHGEGAMEEGVFHESANFAALKRLSVVFIAENNLYSVYTPLVERQPDRDLCAVFGAHGIPAVHEDGNDVESVAAAMASAVERARSGAGPAAIVLDTYRWLEHCGPNDDDHLGYRPPGELATWARRCPVARYEERLTSDGLWSGEDAAAARRRVLDEVGPMFEDALAAPFPDYDLVEALARVTR